MSKFKVGDVVKPAPLSEMYIRYNLNPDDRGVVIKDDENTFFNVLVDWGRSVYQGDKKLWAFDSEIELAIEPLKDMLINSTFIKSRSGEIAYIKNGFIYFGLKGIDVGLYDKNLYNDVDLDYEIMRVYKINECETIELVWKRVEYSEKEQQIDSLVSDKVDYISRDFDGNLIGLSEYEVMFVKSYDMSIFNDCFIDLKNGQTISIKEILEIE